jgi:hypothetical protein
VTTIPGASQYLAASQYATKTGQAAASTSLADTMGSSLLSVGRRLATTGIGLSDNARALTENYLNQASGNANNLFSAAIGNTATVEALQLQVLAIRASKSDSQLARSLLQVETDDGSIVDSDGNIVSGPNETGTVVDEEA